MIGQRSLARDDTFLSVMSFESDNEMRRNAAERREAGVEANKEKQAEEMEKKMGAKERAEKVTREVRTTQQQAQRVMGSMQQVVKAVAAIRAQLKLTTKPGDDSIPSVEQDKKVLEQLQKKMFDLKSQLGDLRTVLTQENARDVEKEHPGWDAAQVQQAAEALTEEWVKRLGLGND